MIITKDKLGAEDIVWYDGVETEFVSQRQIGTAIRTVTLSKVGSVVDVLQVYGSGVLRNYLALANAINAIGNKRVTLLLAPGTWEVDNDLDIPENISLYPVDATLEVASGVTLNLYGRLVNPQRDLFRINGTGQVKFMYAAEVVPEWFGAPADGINDDSAAFQQAIDSLVSGGVVVLSPATYVLRDILIPANVSIKGAGPNLSVIKCDSTKANGYGTFNASAPWFHQKFGGFTMTHEGASGTNICFFYSRYGASSCSWENFIINTVYGTTEHGIWLQGYRYEMIGEPPEQTLVPNNNLYNNLIQHFRIRRVSGTGYVSGYGVYLDGLDTTNCRANANTIMDGVIDNFDTGVFIWGNGNLLQRVTFNTSKNAIEIKGNQNTTGNIINACYFDPNVGQYYLKLVSTYAGTSSHIMATVIEPVNLNWTRISATNTAGGSVPTIQSVGRSLNTFQVIVNPQRDKVARVVGGQFYGNNVGSLILSGDRYSSDVNMVSRSGGISLAAAAHGYADIRLVRKYPPPYSDTYARLMTINLNGVMIAEGLNPAVIQVDSSSVDPSTDEINLGSSLDFTSSAIDINNDTIYIPGHGLTAGTRLAFGVRSGTAPTVAPYIQYAEEEELSEIVFYYPIILDANTIKLAYTASRANSGIAIDFLSAGNGSFSLSTEANMHKLYVGQPLVLNAANPPGGLSDSTVYYVVLSGYNRIKLASSLDNAINGTYLDLTSTGSGTLNFYGGAPAGSFYSSASVASFKVYNASCNANAVIMLVESNSAAQTFDKNNGRPYVTPASGYFTVTTGSGTFTGNELYRYFMIGRRA